MSLAKSSLLRTLIKRYQQARFIERNPDFDTQSLIDLEKSDPYTRRKFIKDSAKALTILGISSVIPFYGLRSRNANILIHENKTKALKTDPIVAIIGGGIAGLNCAYQLKKQNIIAKIYEADTRIGGRILSKEDALGHGLVTEFGGEFIDSNNADILDLVKEFGLELLDTHADIKENQLIHESYYFQYQKRTPYEVINEFRTIVSRIETDKLKCGREYETPFAKKMDNTSLEEYVTGLSSNSWFKDLLKFAYVAEFGMEASEQSSLNLLDMIETNLDDSFLIFGESDERYKVKGGNSRVTEELYKNLKDQVLMDMKLLSIKNLGNSYDLIFENGKTFKADIVVLAIPFTILRNIDLQIEGISPEKLKCINELGYGQNNKLILATNNRPWREQNNKQSGYLFHRDIHNGWDSSQMQNNNSGIGSYTIFLGGDESLKMANEAKNQNLKDQVPETYINNFIPKLDLMFSGMKNAYSGKHKAALWSNNPFIKASYASYSIGQWTNLSGKEMEPIGNIYFAGEHCSTDFQGYMNGGAETARRVAQTILTKINSTK